MKKIVLPVDFSDSTKKLITETIQFAKDINAEIALIHVASSDIGFVIGDMGYQYYPELEESEMKYELKELLKIEELIASFDVKCSHILKQGNPGDTILDYAEQEKADFISVGSHGRSGIYDVFIGSLTKEITRKSKIPVLVIPCFSAE